MAKLLTRPVWQEPSTLVFFDVEATGLTGSKITEVSFVAVHKAEFREYQKKLQKYFQAKSCENNGRFLASEPPLPRVVNKLTLAVCPRKPITPLVEELTGLNNYNLEHQATWSGGVGSAVTAFLALLAPPVCLVAHNGLRFDYPLLRRELESARIELDAGLLVCDTWHFLLHFYTGEERLAGQLPGNGSFLPAGWRSRPEPPFNSWSRSRHGGAAPALAPAQSIKKFFSSRAWAGAGSQSQSSQFGCLEPEPPNNGPAPQPCSPQSIKKFFSSRAGAGAGSRSQSQSSQFCCLEPEPPNNGPAPQPCSPAQRLFTTPERKNGNQAPSTPKKSQPVEPSPLLTPPPSARKRKPDSSERLLHLRKKLITQKEFCGHLRTSLETSHVEEASALSDEEDDEMLSEDEDSLEVVFRGYSRYCHQLAVPPPKYSLGQVYCHLFGEDPEVSHGAEADCTTLLKVVAVFGTAFNSWLKHSTYSFRDVKKM